MSQTLSVHFRDTSFWAYDVVSSVFLKFLIDAANGQITGDSDHWLAEPIEQWRVNAVISDFGFFLDDSWSQSQIDVVIDLCRKAAGAIRSRESIPAMEIESWPMVDDQRIFTRGHDPVLSEPVAQFGEAVIALLENTLPKPPEDHWWLFTLDKNVNTIKMLRRE